ncbi:hypothetical protein FQR65_LT12298 [Abscondita terminalis]|nr:hypothetical protein FQR65_LT12298 [Abscondita terminalis]
MLLLCFKSSFLDEGRDLFSKNDYKVKDFRIDNVNFNKELIQDMSFVYTKYNRSTKVGNVTILSRIDLEKGENDSFVQVYRRYGNEYKTFGLSYSFSVCKMTESNIIGFGIQTCGKLSCPIKKNVRQTLCNWFPDFSHLPPFIPEGQYMHSTSTDSIVKMIFKQITLFLLCIRSNFAEENQNLFSKFLQHDYSVKDLRMDTINFNKEFIQDISFVYTKYNRTTKTGNFRILTRVDLTKDNSFASVQVYKRYGNEFKTFGLSFSFYLCHLFEDNVVGLGVQKCGKVRCPIKKDVRQTLCNWIPDYSRLPPFIPDGQYMFKHNTTYKNQFLYNFTFSATFRQRDYDVKDFRIDCLNYNNDLVKDMSFVYRKYNRTIKAGNVTILTRVDVLKNDAITFMEAYKRYGNEFKPFGFRFFFDQCRVFEENILGFGVDTCGKLSCPIKKNVRQTLCNWIPDYSRMPPFIPDGEYMVKHNTTYKNQFLFSYNYYLTVYRQVKILN